MGSAIGLNLHRRYDEKEFGAEKAEQLCWNDLRSRAFMIINEYRCVLLHASTSRLRHPIRLSFFTFSGRHPIGLSNFELNDAELDELFPIGT
jgi:hypothetical protein